MSEEKPAKPQTFPATVLRPCLIGSTHHVRGDHVELPKDRLKRLGEQKAVAPGHVKLKDEPGKLETATSEPKTEKRTDPPAEAAKKKAAAKK